MEITLRTILILLPLTGLAGFIDAVAGGGGLISIPAYMLAGCPPHIAIATNKVSAGMGMIMANYRYARSGYVRWKLSAICALVALCGGSIGAKLSLMVNDRYFKILMLIILPVTAYIVMKGRVLSDDREELSFARTTLIACIVALTVGAYDGFYGPGSGTFMLLLLAGAAHMKLQEANATAKVINLCTCLSSLTVYLINGQVMILLGLAAGLTSMTGAWIGTRFFDKGGAKAVRPVIIAVIVIFFIKIITELTA